MKRRDFGFLLIGTGVGLACGAYLFLYSFIWMHHMFILGFTSYIAPIIVAALPLGMIATGAALLIRERSAQ